MQVKVQTQGFKELQRAFKAMPPEFANKVLATAVTSAAKRISEAARSAAPSSKGARSTASMAYGTLRGNIKHRILRKKNNVTRAAISTRGKAFWGEFLNRGTRYIPASRWWTNVRDSAERSALAEMQSFMVKKMNSLADNIIRRSGAGKK